MNAPKTMHFDDMALGTRFKYPGGKTVWVVLSKFRTVSDSEPMQGTIAEWRPEYAERPSGRGQSICHYDPSEVTGELEIVS